VLQKANPASRSARTLLPARAAALAASIVPYRRHRGLSRRSRSLRRAARWFVAHPGVAFVFVQHLDPKHRSLLPEILSGHPDAGDGGQGGMRVHPITCTSFLRMRTWPSPAAPFACFPHHDRGQHMPVDVFLRSLAEDQKNKAIA